MQTQVNGGFKFVAHLSDLAKGTLYYYMVEAKDHARNKSSLTGSFTTLGE